MELMGYTDKEVETLKKMLAAKIDQSHEKLAFEIEQLRAEFEGFKNKDFKNLEARVTALEKKLAALQNAFANFKVPESSGGGVS